MLKGCLVIYTAVGVASPFNIFQCVGINRVNNSGKDAWLTWKTDFFKTIARVLSEFVKGPHDDIVGGECHWMSSIWIHISHSFGEQRNPRITFGAHFGYSSIHQQGREL